MTPADILGYYREVANCATGCMERSPAEAYSAMLELQFQRLLGAFEVAVFCTQIPENETPSVWRERMWAERSEVDVRL